MYPTHAITQNATTCKPEEVGNQSTTYITAAGCDSTVTIITTLIPTNTCEDNNPLTTDTYNTETCACEHIADKYYILIPNAFSPNNDGVNEAFTVKTIGNPTIRAAIYNRWGELGYENNNAVVHWDGTYKGVQQQIGVYAYLITITYKDGFTVIKKGNITLIN